VIQKVALIASTQSEGYHDFQHTLLNNQYQYCFGVDVFVSSVQGKEAEKELVNCLIRIFNSNTQYDAVVMIRGGGAKTDFHVYDSFKLALAVAKFPIPIITGIGHHKDESIVDLMAHSVTKTPTKAAEFIVSHNRKFEETILQFQQTIIIYSQQILSISNRNLSNLQYSISTSSRKFISDFRQSLRHSNQNIIRSAKNVLFTKSKNLLTQAIHVNTMPAGILNGKRIELQSLKMSFQSFTKTALQNQKSNLSHFESVVKLVDPVNMLKRGFAILSHNQKVIADPNEIKAGMKIEIQIKDEILTSQVLSKQNSNKKI
jgi:exodeoxyribonuclease VII large subunit